MDDFRAQNGNVFRIVDCFNLNGHKIRLLNEVIPVDLPYIIRLSRVGFSNDRSLAIVVVSRYCGTLCAAVRVGASLSEVSTNRSNSNGRRA